jgi:hypothetical protein
MTWNVSFGNPHFHETVQSVKSEMRVVARDVHHVTSAEEASEPIPAHKGVGFAQVSADAMIGFLPWTY